MSHVLRRLMMMTLLAAPMGQLSADERPPRAIGASQNADAESASSSESSAEKSLRVGIRAYVTGEPKLAIASLSTALQGTLPSNQTARALFYRGLAHRKQGMPGWAVSDLTRALQQVDGLSDTERSEAEENRTAASREAGLPETESAVVTLPFREDAQIASAASVVRNPAPVPSKDQPIVTGSIASAQEPRPANSDWSGATKVAAVAPAPAAVVPVAFVTQVAAVAPAPAAEVPTASITQVAAIAPAPAAEVPTAFITRVAAIAPGPAAQVPTAFVTRVAAIAPASAAVVPVAFVTQVAAVAPAPAAEVPAASITQVAAIAPEKKLQPPGAVHLQVATARSPSEAFALSVRLTSQYGGEFGGHKLQVSKTLAENQGTTYRLRLGPYANAEEPQKLCVSLRASGYECLIE